MTSQDIAWAIDVERLEVGFTIEEFIKCAGITRQTYGKALQGGHMNFETVAAMARAVGFELILRKQEGTE